MKILVLCGNPKSTSFCLQLAEAYCSAAQTKHQVKLVQVSQLHFDANLEYGYSAQQSLEPNLMAFQQDLLWAEHLVIIAPVWWGGIPAQLKGLIDRTFLPNFAFRYEKGKSRPQALLAGRTAQIVLTLDTPVWYYYLFQGAPAARQLKQCTLEFSGINCNKIQCFGPVMQSNNAQRRAWVLALVGTLSKL